MSETRTVVITSNVFPGLEVEQEVLAPLNVELVKRPCQNQDHLIEAGKDAAALIIGNVPINARCAVAFSPLPGHCQTVGRRG